MNNTLRKSLNTIKAAGADPYAVFSGKWLEVVYVNNLWQKTTLMYRGELG